MKIKREISTDMYPWFIWTRMFSTDGELLGESRSVKGYERHGNAVRVAQQMYAGPFDGIRFEWVVAKTCPWPCEQIVAVEIELTHDELATAYNCYEYYIDCEYVRNRLNQGDYEEFESLSDEEWEKTVSIIAYKKREQQDEYLYDEDFALDNAIESYIKEYLSCENNE